MDTSYIGPTIHAKARLMDGGGVISMVWLADDEGTFTDEQLAKVAELLPEALIEGVRLMVAPKDDITGTTSV